MAPLTRKRMRSEAADLYWDLVVRALKRYLSVRALRPYFERVRMRIARKKNNLRIERIQNRQLDNMARRMHRQLDDMAVPTEHFPFAYI